MCVNIFTYVQMYNILYLQSIIYVIYKIISFFLRKVSFAKLF